MIFNQTQTPDEMKQLMNSVNPLEREAALDNYPAEGKSVLPQLVEMIKSDGNLGVLYRAVSRFNLLTKQSFVFWNTDALLEWWDKNRGSLQ